ncbi:hypothetical protein J437_LFUL005249 [Ladona fulva]|uniref:Uncharacterized protein n=1 Tax=Ladona fulva TaxID=123851 RepID=A0A8K0K1R4_LADFU|nr:hypothetical protein J437_LFUL005249 [Ladona fulva]
MNVITYRCRLSAVNPADRCKLYCRVSHSNAYYRLGDKVKDGTTCGPDTYDVCINGICYQADCSHTIKPISPLQVDICGKCGGDNSTCRLIGGEYNISSYGYRRVVLIPAGSSNIDIRQSGYRGTAKDDNYLALVNADTGEYLLNGNFIVSMFRKLIIYGGTTIEYSGSDAATERINSSRPLSKDLIVEVLSVGKLNPPNVFYQYTVLHNKPQYRWELQPEWSRCSSECQGEQLRKPMCIKETAGVGQIVRDDFCSHLSRPRHHVQLCNTHCTLRWWKVSHESPCSVHTCSKTRTIQCVREVHSRGGSPQVHVVEPSYCDHLSGKPHHRISCHISCRAEWKPTDWTPCSATCGEGVQRRKFVCVDSNGKETVPKFCKGGKHHIPEEQKCKIQECPRWATGEWTPCSVTCGIGEQQRPYWCELEGKPVAEGYCRSHGGDHDSIPVHIQHCKALPCPYLSDRENWIQEEVYLHSSV